MKHFPVIFALGFILLSGCKQDLSEEEVRKLVVDQWPASSEQKIEDAFKRAGFQVSFVAKESRFYALLPVRSSRPFTRKAILVRARVDAAWNIEELKVLTEYDSL